MHLKNIFSRDIKLKGYVEEGGDFGRGIENTVAGAMSESKWHYAGLITSLVVIGIIAIAIVIVNYKPIL